MLIYIATSKILLFLTVGHDSIILASQWDGLCSWAAACDQKAAASMNVGGRV